MCCARLITLKSTKVLFAGDRHTIRPVLARIVPVLRALSRSPGQSTKMSRLGIQPTRIHTVA